jgi:hypothetical protein
MYPAPDLTRLALHKAALRRRIAVRRAQVTCAMARLAQPVEFLDRALAFWRRLSPFTRFAAVPLGFLLKSSVAPRVRVLGTLLRWGPVVLGAVRSFTNARRKPSCH